MPGMEMLDAAQQTKQLDFPSCSYTLIWKTEHRYFKEKSAVVKREIMKGSGGLGQLL